MRSGRGGARLSPTPQPNCHQLCSQGCTSPGKGELLSHGLNHWLISWGRTQSAVGAQVEAIQSEWKVEPGCSSPREHLRADYPQERVYIITLGCLFSGFPIGASYKARRVQESTSWMGALPPWALRILQKEKRSNIPGGTGKKKGRHFDYLHAYE